MAAVRLGAEAEAEEAARAARSASNMPAARSECRADTDMACCEEARRKRRRTEVP